MSIFGNSVLKQYRKCGCIPKQIVHHEKWEIKTLELFLSRGMQQKSARINHYSNKFY